MTACERSLPEERGSESGDSRLSWVDDEVRPILREDRKLPRRLLVVINTVIPEGVLRALLHSRAAADAETLAAAPALEISRLSWLTNAEENARSEAHSLAVTTGGSRANRDGSLAKSRSGTELAGSPARFPDRWVRRRARSTPRWMVGLQRGPC